jgi:hypothetical protein
VRVRQGFTGSRCNEADERPRHGRSLLLDALQEQVVQRHAFDILHGDEGMAGDAPEVEDLHDVGVRQPRRDPGFVEEHIDETPVERQVLVNALDDQDLAETLDADVPRQEDLGHTAGGEQLQEQIPPRR